MSYDNYSKIYCQTWSALNYSLPYNVHLLTLEQWSSKVFLIRLEHYFELYEDEIFSKSVQFNIQHLFSTFGKIDEVVELTLGANLPLNDKKRLVWRINDNESSFQKSIGINIYVRIQLINTLFSVILDSSSSKNTTITLRPMEIRTFQVTLQ